MEEENTIMEEENMVLDQENKINELLKNDADISDLDITSFYNLQYHLKYSEINIQDISPDDFESLERYDQTYREDLILLFRLGITLAIGQNLNDVLEACSKAIYHIYQKWCNHEQIKEILGYLKDTIILPFVELSEDALFTYLFSCDYLEFFHECIKDLHYHNKISELNFNNLINKIKEN